VHDVVRSTPSVDSSFFMVTSALFENSPFPEIRRLFAAEVRLSRSEARRSGKLKGRSTFKYYHDEACNLSMTMIAISVLESFEFSRGMSR